MNNVRMHKNQRAEKQNQQTPPEIIQAVLSGLGISHFGCDFATDERLNVPAAILGNAMTYCLVEVIEAVRADAAWVRCDVGRKNSANRGFHGQAAGKRFAAFGGVAGHTVPGSGQVFALFDQRLLIGLGGHGREAAQ